MNMIERNHCVLTGEKDLEPLFSFNNFPIFMGCTDQAEELDVKVDMNWTISKSTGCIQLNPLLPLEVLYSASHHAGTVGALWLSHHAAFADFIHDFAPKSILEIGGGHGILSTQYQRHAQIPWTIIEPNPAPIDGCKAKFIKGFLDKNFTPDRQYEAVVHSHLLEHLYEPKELIQNIASFQSDNSLHFFSIPNMEVMLKRKYTNCINFEHTVYLTEPYIEYLLHQSGFYILKKTYFLDDHSIFYATQKNNCSSIDINFDGLYLHNLNSHNEYVTYYKDLILSINKSISMTNKPVYLFGAHIFAQYLIAFGLDVSCIHKIIDNDPHKLGKRLYGSSLMVDSPRCLGGDNPLVILKAGVYNKEIKKSILENINNNVEFIE